MILNEITGDVTAPTVGIIGHGVNCQGVMGSGVALTIRNKFPKAYQAYLKLCEQTSDRQNLLGTTQLVEVGPQLYVANMFTQFNYGRDGGPYASIQAVRGACAHLELLRYELIKKLYVDERAAIEELVANMFRSPLDVKLPYRSRRAEMLADAADHAIAAMTDADATDDPDRVYVLPIHLPLIGCGLGGLEWDTTRPSIDSHTGHAPVTIYHYPK